MTIITKAENLTIATQEDLITATSVLSELNRAKDAIILEREKVTRPLLDALNAERARWKPQETKLDNLITKIRGAMTTFQTALIAKQRLQEEAIAKKVESGAIKPETAIRRLGQIEDVDKRVETASGSVSFKTVMRFEVVDIDAVPNEYLLVNEVKVRQTLKEGKAIPGIREFEEQIPINTR